MLGYACFTQWWLFLKSKDDGKQCVGVIKRKWIWSPLFLEEEF